MQEAVPQKCMTRWITINECRWDPWVLILKVYVVLMYKHVWPSALGIGKGLMKYWNGSQWNECGESFKNVVHEWKALK